MRRNPVHPIPPLGDDWAESIFATPTEPHIRKLPVWKRSVLVLAGARPTLSIKRFRSGAAWLYVWYLTERRSVIAVGMGAVPDTRPDVFRTGAAVVVESRRATGIYRAVLRELRRLIGLPMESDTSLTVGSIGAWKRAGAVESTRDGSEVYRIENPKKPQQPYRYEFWAAPDTIHSAEPHAVLTRIDMSGPRQEAFHAKKGRPAHSLRLIDGVAIFDNHPVVRKEGGWWSVGAKGSWYAQFPQDPRKPLSVPDKEGRGIGIAGYLVLERMYRDLQHRLELARSGHAGSEYVFHRQHNPTNQARR